MIDDDVNEDDREDIGDDVMIKIIIMGIESAS